MSNQLPVASYPASVWNGLHDRRTSPIEKRAPDKFDYDRLTAELIAAQEELNNIKAEIGTGGESTLAERVTTLEQTVTEMQKHY